MGSGDEETSPRRPVVLVDDPVGADGADGADGARDVAPRRFGEPQEQHADPETGRIVPSWSDAVARSASGAVGGPWGRHGIVGRGGFVTPMRVLLAFAVLTLLVAWVKERPCAFDPWQGSLQYTHACYSDAIPLYGIEGIQQGVLPYYGIDPTAPVGSPTYAWGRVEYPVLIAGFWVVADGIGRVLTDASQAVFTGDSVLTGWQGYFVATALLLSACFLLAVWATARTAGKRIWDAAILALSPLVMMHAFTNWDLIAVALSAVALLLWARRRPVWAGVFLGLGTAAKLYPVLILGALLVLAIRTGRYRALVRTALAAGLTWAVVNLPVAFTAYDGWRIFYDNSRTRPFDFDTLWQIGERIVSGLPQFAFATAFSETATNALTFIALGLACLAILWLGLAAPVRPRVAQLAFLVVAAFLLTGKVWSPQFSLWLLPLIALARPQWRLVLAWQLSEVFLWVTRLQWFVKRDVTYLNTTRAAENKPLLLLSGIDWSWFAFAVLVRDALVIALCVLVVREILDPALDVVRRSGLDDPTGGDFEGAPDRRVLRRPAHRVSAPPRPEPDGADAGERPD